MKNALIVAGLVVLALVGWMWLRREHANHAVATLQNTPQTKPEITITIQDVGGSTQSTTIVQAPPALNTLPPEQLTMSMVNAFSSQGGQPVLIFTDGSQMPVTPSVMASLPSDIRFRLEYKRGRP